MSAKNSTVMHNTAPPEPARPTVEERSRFQIVANNLILHLHPVSVPAQALQFTYTWGLGGISAVLVILLSLTGLLLMFRYDARVQYAYISIQQLETQVMFGSLVRAIHHWSANLLVLTSFLHLLRVFITGSFKQGRTANWLIGVGLLVLALASNFSGYLLPWDQLSYWAVTVSTTLMTYIPLVGAAIRNFFLGGPQVGQAALSNFYALHVVVLPSLIISMMAYHFWKIRKNGGISQPLQRPAGTRTGRLPTIPYLVNVEIAAGLTVVALVMLWSMLRPAPLGDIANPVSSPNPAKAAWFFLGLQELLLHMHPLSALGLFGVLAAAVLFTPLIDRREDDIGVYFRSPAGQQTALVGALLGLNLTPIMVILDEYWLDLPGWMPWLSSAITTGWIPFLATLGVFGLIYAGLRATITHNNQHANHSEAILGVFAFAVSALIVLTLVGIYFRGPNMALGLPF